MPFTKYIPKFLLPTDEPAAPVRIYDVPLRRELFHKASPGNEYTVSASRNNSVVSQTRRDSTASTESRPISAWRPSYILRSSQFRHH